MCLAVPGRVEEIVGDGLHRSGKVSFGGVSRQANMAFLPEAQVGDYVLVHVGIAISQVDRKSAEETLAMLREMGEEELS